MSGLTDWEAAAYSRRRADLVHFNYTYEQTGSAGAVDPMPASALESLLDDAKSRGLSFQPADALRELSRRSPDIERRGVPIDYHGPLASIFNALKFARVFGIDYDVGDPRQIVPNTERASIGAHVEATVRQTIGALRLSSTAPVASATTVAGRRVRRPAGSHLDKVFPDDTLWVTTFADTRSITSKSLTRAQRALALRRALGLPTIHRTAAGATTVEGLLANLFFRAHFREAVTAAPEPLRKPTVFSGGFPDIYGTYAVTAPGDGWGRTVTLCAGDAFDGCVGLKEAVVSMKNLVCTSVVRLGRVDQEDQPLDYASLVDVPIFLQRRHHDDLGMDVS